MGVHRLAADHSTSGKLGNVLEWLWPHQTQMTRTYAMVLLASTGTQWLDEPRNVREPQNQSQQLPYQLVISHNSCIHSGPPWVGCWWINQKGAVTHNKPQRHHNLGIYIKALKGSNNISKAPDKPNPSSRQLRVLPTTGVELSSVPVTTHQQKSNCLHTNHVIPVNSNHQQENGKN